MRNVGKHSNQLASCIFKDNKFLHSSKPHKVARSCNPHVDIDNQPQSHLAFLGLSLNLTIMDLNDEVTYFSSAMFQDPPGYFPPEPAATYAEYTLSSGQIIQLRLVGHNPLWVSIFEIHSSSISRNCLILASRSLGTSPLERQQSHIKIPTTP